MPLILPVSSYRRADDLPAALSALAELGARAKILAGGTDVVVQLRDGHHADRTLLDISRVKELRRYERDGREIVLGALARYADIERSALTRGPLALLAEAARVVGGPMIRNAGTVGGNLANGSPAADIVPPLLALEAEVVLESARGRRRLPLESFFTGYRKNVLEPDELVREIRFAEPPASARGRFFKVGQRNASAISVVAVAAVAVPGHAGPASSLRIALGAVAPVPMRARRAEAVALGRPLTRETIRRAGDEAAAECSPITDLRGSEWYRRQVVRGLVERFLESIAAG
jgi:CO/xanthine dehydrogenase FAD-binding subunit